MRGDGSLDALFTITSTNSLATNNVGFVDEPARGSNVRVRVGGSTDVAEAKVFIDIDFVNAGSTIAYTGWGTGDELITQFSDLDSDEELLPSFKNDRTDFAGVHNSDFTANETSDNVSPGSSFLTFDATAVTNYTIARMKEPWGPQANVSATDATSQSPVTAAYTRDAQNKIRVVVGQLSDDGNANRHVDIDMTPDFNIVPEPSSFALLAGLAGLGMAMTARRRRQ